MVNASPTMEQGTGTPPVPTLAQDIARLRVSLADQRLAYTMKETAAILGLSYITVHRLIQRGLLRSSSALRHKVIPRVEIERFLKETSV